MSPLSTWVFTVKAQPSQATGCWSTSAGFSVCQGVGDFGDNLKLKTTATKRTQKAFNLLFVQQYNEYNNKPTGKSSDLKEVYY